MIGIYIQRKLIKADSKTIENYLKKIMSTSFTVARINKPNI